MSAANSKNDEMKSFMSILLIVAFCAQSNKSTHCDKELNYHDNYGYGIDILCDGISNENINMLREISVSNEILLDIKKSNLNITSSNLFSKLSEIRILTISDSNLTFYNKSGANVFQTFNHLQHVIMINSDLSFDNNFTLPNTLKELNVTNITSLSINTEMMSNLSNLEILTISFNNLSSLSQLSLCNLKLLKNLHLKGNSLNSNYFSCNSGTNHLQLIEIDFSYNKFVQLDRFDRLTKLKHLNLENNRIRKINGNIFVDIPNIEKINLNSNFLEDVEDNLLNLSRIQSIDLENNKLDKIRIENNPNLFNINLASNKLVLNSVSNLKNLPNLKNLNISRNNLNGVLINTFSNLRFLEILDLSYNNIILDNTAFLGLQHLIKLYLQGNHLKEIPISTFKNLNELKKIDLSRNKLIEINSDATFQNCFKLEILDMSYNRLERLDYETLRPLKNLQILDIAGNRLKHFQYDLVSLLPSLTVINIKNNSLPCDILTNMIVFLKHEHINFTINEELDYSRQNVAGIFCTNPARIAKNIRYGLMMTFVVMVFSLTFVVISYKLILYSRRRHYVGDEIELIENE